MIGKATPGGSGFGGGVDGGGIGTGGDRWAASWHRGTGRPVGGTDRHGGTTKSERRNQSLGLRSVDAAAEQIIVEGAGAQFASGQGRTPRGGRRPADRAHHLNAVAGRFRTRTTDLVTCTMVLPVAAPPLMTNLSEGEPSPPSKVLMAIVPPAPA